MNRMGYTLLFISFVLLPSYGYHTILKTVYIQELNYSEPFNGSVNSSSEYVLELIPLKNLSEAIPARVTVSSDAASLEAPLMIVTAQKKNILSWNIPMYVEILETKLQNSVKKRIKRSFSFASTYKNTSRTLCYDLLAPNDEILNETLRITISTASEKNLDFSVDVSRQVPFVLNHSTQYNVEISPSSPMYFFYNFSGVNSEPLEWIGKNFDTVILEVSSEDEICTVVSIQNVSCPVFDLNQDITFRGFYETFNTKGGITIPKYKFPYGFYVVFVAKNNDYACTHQDVIPLDNRTKKLSLIIKPSISYNDYVAAVLYTLGSIGAFYLIFGLAFFYCSRKHLPRHTDYTVSTSTSVHNTTTASPVGDSPKRSPAGSLGDIMESQSISDVDYDTLQRDLDANIEIRLARTQPRLCDLAKRHPKILAKKSYLYFYNVLTVAVFYGLPVVQLVITYQRVLNETGQQDLCYYNFLCSHPVGFLSDFNHVFSNVGYVLLGLLFLFITYHREISHKDINFDMSYGIPQHYGLFYAMGVALMMEGILSGCYHVCPSLTNFQFDSSFMYVMAVLCMVKLYQNRHPDINANAYSTFGILAVAILLGMIGILRGTEEFWIFFVVLYLLTCLFLSIKIYYMGCWKLNFATIRGLGHTMRNDFLSGPINLLTPVYKGRFVMLFLGNLINWGLAGFALYSHPHNFAIFLLMVFMANTLLYFFFYIAMKYIYKEYIKLTTWFFLIVSVMCAISAMYFFLHKSISNSTTPAISRQFNSECTLLRFYDYHDIWHFLSAIGMFFTFMVLLTLDDDISHTHHSEIPVF